MGFLDLTTSGLRASDYGIWDLPKYSSQPSVRTSLSEIQRLKHVYGVSLEALPAYSGKSTYDVWFTTWLGGRLELM